MKPSPSKYGQLLRWMAIIFKQLQENEKENRHRTSISSPGFKHETPACERIGITVWHKLMEKF